MQGSIFSKYGQVFIISSALVLASCGGGGGGAGGGDGSKTPTSIIIGTAAVGSPIVGGTTAVKCASSTALPSTTTSSVGGLSITLTGQTYPCALQITGGTINSVTNTTAYHSIALSAGNANATPLTDLLVANLAGTTTPSTWFANLTTAQLAGITVPRVTTALTNLQNALGSTLPTSINPITTVFKPVAGVQMDDVLSAFAIALANNGTSHANLLTFAGGSIGAAFTPTDGFNTAFAGGFTKTLTGGGTPSATSFSPTTVAPGGTVTITGTNLLPVTKVILIGPASGTNSSPTILSNSRSDGVMGTQTATSIAVTLPAGLATGSYTVSTVYPGGGLITVETLTVTADGQPKVALTAPGSFAATASGKKVNLSWQAVVGAKGYNLYKSTVPGGSFDGSSKVPTCSSCTSSSPTIGDGSITTFTDGKGFIAAYYDPGVLSPRTTYYYVIRALNNANEESPNSAEVSATTGP